MATITLDSIREAADAKYGATVIDLGDRKVELVNALRLSKEKREALSSAHERTEGGDVTDTLREIIRIAAKNERDAEALIEALGDDAALLSLVVETYSKGTELGEASPSES